MAHKVCVVFFMGQGGALTSQGMLFMTDQARKLGYEAQCFTYDQYKQGEAVLDKYRPLGYKLAVVGYSLGAGTATYVENYERLDLLVALDPSQLGYNYKLNHANVAHSILWHNSNWLNGPFGHAGLGLGFMEVHETLDPHVFVDKDPMIQKNIFDNLAKLAA